MDNFSGFPAEDEAGARDAIHFSVLTIVWRSLAVVFAAEFLVMILLHYWTGIPFGLRLDLLDALLLSAIALPVLYHAVLRPVAVLAAGQAAAAANSRLKAVARRAQDGILVFGLDRVIQFANPAMEKIHGYEAGALLGQPVECLMPQEVAGIFRAGMRQFHLLGKDKVIGKGPMEFAGVRKDGQRIQVEISVDNVWTGREAQFIAIVRDVTMRKQAEEVLRESEKQLRRILDALPVAVRIVQEGKVVFANPADARLHGYERPEEEIGAEISRFLAEEEKDRILAFARAREEGGEAPRWHETRARRRDGSTVSVEVSAERIIHGGAPAGLVAIRDLTEQQRLELYEKILPVCCVCGRIRDESGAKRGEGEWVPLDEYVALHSNAQFSHGFCEGCYREYRKKEGLLS
ncbi:MAG: PAS domain S-box protein [Acidobacteriia bacterium]|nr:PAS domain S-box protein [Terriglobia bacterium]